MAEENTEIAERLARAEASYVAGNFAAVRAQCAALGEVADPELRARASALGSRVATDAAAWIALSASLALLVGILVAYAV